MKITFVSVFDDEIVSFESECIKEDNNFYFKDQSVDNTDIALKIINKDEILFIRSGSTNMNIHLKTGDYKDSNYSNDMGLVFKFKTFCHKIDITLNKIEIKYTNFIDGIDENEYELYILID